MIPILHQFLFELYTASKPLFWPRPIRNTHMGSKGLTHRDENGHNHLTVITARIEQTIISLRFDPECRSGQVLLHEPLKTYFDHKRVTSCRCHFGMGSDSILKGLRATGEISERHAQSLPSRRSRLLMLQMSPLSPSRSPSILSSCIFSTSTTKLPI